MRQQRDADGMKYQEKENKFLGRFLTPRNQMPNEIDKIIISAWKRFGYFPQRPKDVNMSEKFMAYETDNFSFIIHKRDKKQNVTQKSVETRDQWTGHVFRMKNNARTQKITEHTPWERKRVME